MPDAGAGGWRSGDRVPGVAGAAGHNPPVGATIGPDLGRNRKRGATGNVFFIAHPMMVQEAASMSDSPCILSPVRAGIPALLVMLAFVVLCAGCVDSSRPPGTGPDTAVPSGTPAGPGADTCTFDRLTGDAGVHISQGDSCYFTTHTPMDFLTDLRMHPDTPVMVLDVPDTWITRHDAELLMREIDSLEPAAPVVSPISSYWPHNQTSTVGNEAMFLLEGYRTGRYPPGLCSLYSFAPDRTEVRSWWNTYGKQDLPDERDAVRIVQDACPEVKGYPSDELPPRSIRTEKTPDGWYVAFIQEGSGLPILSARCYHVGNDRNVTVTGTVNHSIMVLPQDFSPQRCG